MSGSYGFSMRRGDDEQFTFSANDANCTEFVGRMGDENYRRFLDSLPDDIRYGQAAHHVAMIEQWPKYSVDIHHLPEKTTDSKRLAEMVREAVERRKSTNYPIPA